MVKTIVRVKDSMVELTYMGWKTDDQEIADFCRYAWRCRGAPPFDTNPNRALAEQLIEACREWHLDAEIISITPFERHFSNQVGEYD